ncbi:MAG: hypothetical protein QOJ94_2346 [Sphingomonadales bacterium]|jgi:hypothetical protein|nr:hypothetical protein [Sphingomonadales bacterium]
MSGGFFKTRRSGPVLSRDEFARQGHAVRAASAAFTDSGAVRAFLNSHHSGLGGRPLDLAVASATGLAAVQTAICAETAHVAAGNRLRSARDGA